MFVRFRFTLIRLQVSLAETCRTGGKVRRQHVAALGSICQPMTVADRAAFWMQLRPRLDKLATASAPIKSKSLTRFTPAFRWLRQKSKLPCSGRTRRPMPSVGRPSEDYLTLKAIENSPLTPPARPRR
jgi:hypothetical protein